MSKTTALATQNETQLSQAVQKTAVDPEIIALASAFFTAGEMTKEQAVKAAYFFYQTGQVEGRDSYIGTTGNVSGKVLEGYRGIARDVGRDYEVKYRRPTAAEIEEHSINPKGKALVCEVYVLDIWQRKQRMGLPYEPVIGIAYYPPGAKINVPATKTEHWVLQKNARKDALRQVPGVPLDADEVLEEAAAAGLHVEIPDGVQLTAEQARLWVKSAQAEAERAEFDAGMTDEQRAERLRANVLRMRGPEWDAFDEADGEYRVEALTAEQPAQPAASEPAPFEPEPGEDVWADWRKPADAQAWAMAQGKFNAQKHMENAYANVKEDCKPANAREMWRCWYAYVMAHEPAKAQASGDGDGWAEVDAAGHDVDEPLFS